MAGKCCPTCGHESEEESTGENDLERKARLLAELQELMGATLAEPLQGLKKPKEKTPDGDE